MRKLMMVMIDSVLLILVEVQAINIVSTSLHPTSLQMLLPYPSKIDNVKSIFQLCLEEEIAECENMPKGEDPNKLVLCIMESFEVCIEKFEHEYDPVFLKSLRFVDHCYNKHKIAESPKNYTSFVNCVYDFYKRHFKKP